jgi:hypothetical protein
MSIKKDLKATQWQVKAGRKSIYSHPTKFSCQLFVLENQSTSKQKLRIVPLRKERKA